MSNNKTRSDGDSTVLTVTTAMKQAGIKLGTQLTQYAIDGGSLNGNVVDDPEGASEISPEEWSELRDAIASKRREQLVNREDE